MSESAIQQYNREQEVEEQEDGSKIKNKSFFINYNKLPEILWESVLPNLGVQTTGQRIKKMEKAAAMYTKGRSGGNKFGSIGAIFMGDSHHKQKDVPFEIAQAVSVFMDETYEQLETLSKKTQFLA